MFEYVDQDEKPVVLSKHAGHRVLEIKGKLFVDMRDPSHAAVKDLLVSTRITSSLNRKRLNLKS